MSDIFMGNTLCANSQQFCFSCYDRNIERLKNYGRNYDQRKKTNERKLLITEKRESAIQKIRDRHATISAMPSIAEDLIYDLNSGFCSGLQRVNLTSEFPMLQDDWKCVLNGIKSGAIALVEIAKKDVDSFATAINFSAQYQREIKNSLNSDCGILISDFNGRYKYLCCTKAE
ncbi:MAG: hypothetical protein LBI56_04290 [Puniceicoccales bacterium]|jgi:hypothetical protein|nr:hypothetical protein [Puniceicoccales bacterium]